VGKSILGSRVVEGIRLLSCSCLHDSNLYELSYRINEITAKL
jgi:hypothetical protein